LGGTIGSVICKEMMEYDMFPKAESTFFFGLAQSAFSINLNNGENG